MAFVIATPEIGDEATVTTDSEHANGPVTNVTKMQPTIPWLTASAAVTSAYARFDLVDNTLGWRTVAVLTTNINSTARWRVTADDSTTNLGTASANYDSGWMTFWPSNDLDDWNSVSSYLHLANVEYQRYVQINFDTLTVQLSVGRIYVSNSWQPTKAPDFGISQGWQDLSSRQETAHGGIIARRIAARKTLDFTLKVQGQGAKNEVFNNFYNIMRTRGGTKDVLIIPDTTDNAHKHENIYYGLLSVNNAITIPRYGVYQQRVSLVELI